MSLAWAIGLSAPCLAEGKGYVPPDGFVPTSAVADQIAEAVLVPIYGAKIIAEERPFKTRLEGDVWIVEGTLKETPGTITMGGVFTIKISRRTGEILYVMHTR
jgi:hypothetical protein